MSETEREQVEPIEGEDGAAATWGRLLRERRESAALSQAELARRAGLSEGTIKRIESGKEVSRDSLLRLAGVPELRLHELPIAGAPVTDEMEPSFIPNCWIAPGFNALELCQEMVRELNGQGGHIDQTHLYLDHISGTGWYAMATHESYQPGRAAMPLDKAAGAVLDSIGSAGLDVIGLGSGDGRDETRVVVHLLDDPRHHDVRLFLLDISQPLLSAAFEHASETLAGRERVSVTAVLGNFHHLSRYRQLLYTPRRAHIRRLVTMFGGTFPNLLNEPLFIRNSLAGFGPGDLMLMNAGLAYAPIEQPDEIRKKDRILANRDPATLSPTLRLGQEWLGGPLRRYVKGVQDLKVSYELDLSSCPVPGSYAVVHRVTMTMTNGEVRTFSAFFMKRYDEEKLVECFRQAGWDSIARWHYGTGLPMVLFLFRKR